MPPSPAATCPAATGPERPGTAHWPADSSSVRTRGPRTRAPRIRESRPASHTRGYIRARVVDHNNTDGRNNSRSSPAGSPAPQTSRQTASCVAPCPALKVRRVGGRSAPRRPMVRGRRITPPRDRPQDCGRLGRGRLRHGRIPPAPEPMEGEAKGISPPGTCQEQVPCHTCEWSIIHVTQGFGGLPKGRLVWPVRHTRLTPRVELMYNVARVSFGLGGRSRT